MGGIEIAQLAKEQMVQLTGLQPDTVSCVSKETDGWHVTVDMIEVKRIPSSTDLLGAYEVMMDDAGKLIAYKRIRRYSRGEAMQLAA